MSRWPLPLLLLCSVACDRSPYPGYKVVGPDVHLHYITLGEGDQLASDSDSVHVRFRSARLGEAHGSYWSSEQWYLTKDLKEGAMRPVFRRLHVGDSMSVIAPWSLWPWKVMMRSATVLPDTGLICTELSLLAIRTPADARRDMAALRREDPAAFERRLINAYIGPDTTAWTRWGTSEMRYRIEGEAVDTNRVRFGDVAHMQWTGRRLEDGRIFDEVGKDGFPWRVGEQDQMIKGLESATGLLREGQRGTFIFPSALAFGASGIPGTLEGGTVVIYEVRLVRVERGAPNNHRPPA